MISAEEFLRGRGVDPRVCDPAVISTDTEAPSKESTGTESVIAESGITGSADPESTVARDSHGRPDMGRSASGEADSKETGAEESSERDSDGEEPDAGGGGSEASSMQSSRSLLRSRGSFGGSATQEWARPTVGSSRGWSQGCGGRARRRRSADPWQSAGHRTASGDDSDGFSAASRRERNAHDLDACQEAALRLLDASARSVRDMQERLVGKGYDPSVVEQVVGNLIRVGLLDDHAYARGLVEHCLGRLLGARGAERELLRKGVPRRIAHDAVQDAEDAGRFATAADELAQKTARRTQGLDRETRLRRFWSAGGRKGHSPQDLRAAAGRYLTDES